MNLPRGRRGKILPPPTWKTTQQTKAEAGRRSEKNARKALRAALTRYEKACGIDGLISALKIELLILGEEAERVHRLAPSYDSTGQSSILNIVPGQLLHAVEAKTLRINARDRMELKRTA